MIDVGGGGWYGAVVKNQPPPDHPAGARPVTTHNQITAAGADVNAHLGKLLSERISELLQLTDATPRDLEKAVWSVVLELGRELLTALLALACWRVTQQETRGREVRLRMDADYVLSQSTTLGTVKVPLFAYRDGPITRAPARRVVFPLHPKVRSSELLLEWEARLGCQLPFRQAEDAMEFFSHGAARVEDTTIARHLGVIGAIIDRTWTCRAPAEIRDILLTRATRDRDNGKPLLYVSSDAHALRRYVDETWKAEFKMLNGIRFWCVDAKTGQTIHLGGEYTWGDCREVASRMRALLADLVPTGDCVPQVVVVTDGMPWIRDHLFPLMPTGTVFILDFYHLSERLSKYAAAKFGAKSRRAKSWVARAVEQLMGKRPYRKQTAKKRRGHKKNRRSRRDPFRTVHPSDHPHGAGEAFVWKLVEDEDDGDALDELVRYIAENTDRTDYPSYRQRGMQIGSGAMESLHRVASQMRLKLAGARWTAARAIAVLNTRLMLLADRWDAFWARTDLTATLQQAFANTPVLAA